MKFLAYVTKCGTKYVGLNDALSKTVHPNTVLDCANRQGVEGIEIVLVDGDLPPNPWSVMPLPSTSSSPGQRETTEQIRRIGIVPFPEAPKEVPDPSIRRSVRTMKSQGLDGAITLQSRFVYHKRIKQWRVCESFGFVLRIDPDILPDALQEANLLFGGGGGSGAEAEDEEEEPEKENENGNRQKKRNRE